MYLLGYTGFDPTSRTIVSNGAVLAPQLGRGATGARRLDNCS